MNRFGGHIEAQFDMSVSEAFYDKMISDKNEHIETLRAHVRFLEKELEDIKDKKHEGLLRMDEWVQQHAAGASEQKLFCSYTRDVVYKIPLGVDLLDTANTAWTVENDVLTITTKNGGMMKISIDKADVYDKGYPETTSLFTQDGREHEVEPHSVFEDSDDESCGVSEDEREDMETRVLTAFVEKENTACVLVRLGMTEQARELLKKAVAEAAETVEKEEHLGSWEEVQNRTTSILDKRLKNRRPDINQSFSDKADE